MTLNVASSAVPGRTGSVRAQKVREAFGCCVIHNNAGIRLAFHADVELVVDTGLTRISGRQREIHVTKLVRSRVSANDPRPDGLSVRIRAVAAIVDKCISRDSGPMSVQARPVVVIFARVGARVQRGFAVVEPGRVRLSTRS